MPKVQVDVDVANQQEIKDLTAQVISLQTSLDKLKTTAQGRPLEPLNQSAGQASGAINQINQQLDVTSQKLQQVEDKHRGLARVGQMAWGALGVYSTLESLPSLARGVASAGRFAWRHAPGMVPEALPEITAAPGLMGTMGAIAAPIGFAAGSLWATNRVADSVQNEILQARSLGLSVDQLNNLKVAASGMRSQALPGFQSLVAGTDTNNMAWRNIAMRSGIAVGKGDDTIDTLAQMSAKIRQLPYESRVTALQNLYPEGDPKQMMDALDANLGRMAKRMDEVNRTVQPSAIENLTKFKDKLNDIVNIPTQINFEANLLGQRIRAGAINMAFADAPLATPERIDPRGIGAAARAIGGSYYMQQIAPGGAQFTGILGSLLGIDPGRSKEGEVLDMLRRKANQQDIAEKKAVADARDITNVSDAMEALGADSGSIKYGKGQTLTATTESIAKAKKFANDFIDTWKGRQGLAKTLAEDMKALATLDAEISRLGEGEGTFPGAARLPEIVNRQNLREKIWAERNTLQTVGIEGQLEDAIAFGRREPSLTELGLRDDYSAQGIRNQMRDMTRRTPSWLTDLGDQAEELQQGLGIYNTFRDRRGKPAEVYQGFIESRQGRFGRIAGMRRQLAKSYSTGDQSADITLNKIIGTMTGDIYREDSQMFGQQRAGYGMQLAQVTAQPGQERQTATEIYKLQEQAAKDYFATSLKGYDEEVKYRAMIAKAGEQYVVSLLQIEQIEKRRANQFESQMAAGAHGFNLQMMGLTAQPGQEMQGFGAAYRETAQYAAEQYRRDLRDVGPAQAQRNYQQIMTQAKQGRTLSETGYGRQRTEEARGYDIQDITSTTQYDVGFMQLWAMPGQERELQGAINARERYGLSQQITRAGGTMTPRQIQSMQSQQALRERGANDQLDRQDYLRAQDLRLEKVRSELQLTTQIVALRTDGALTAQAIHKMQLDALEKEYKITGDIYEYGKQTRAENLSYQQQLNQMNAQRKAAVEQHAGGLFDDIWGASIGRSGGPNRPLAGIGTFLRQEGTQQARTIFTQAAGELWKTISSASGLAGRAIPGQTTTDKDGNIQLTAIGRIFQHTALGVDQLKLVQNTALTVNSNTNTQNTVATQELTRAMTMLAGRVASIGAGGSGGCGCGGGGGGGGSWGGSWGYSPASWGNLPSEGIAANTSRINFGEGWIGDAGGDINAGDGGYDMGYSPAAGYSSAAGLGAGATPLSSGTYSPAAMGYDMGYSPVSPTMMANAKAGSGQGARIATGVGKAAGLVAAGYGTYAGIKKGGAQGGLQAAASALGGAAIFGGPAAPFLMAASIIAGTVSMFLPDPYSSRMKDEDNYLRASQFKPPDPVHLTVNVAGKSVDYDFRGQIRSYGSVSSLGSSPAPVTVTPGPDGGTDASGGAADAFGRFNLNAAARGGRPVVVQNFQLLDTASLMSRRSEIAEVTRAALDDFHPLRQTIQQIGR